VSGGSLSVPLARAVAETVGRGEQVLLFVNRRGFSPLILCASCGAIDTCPHCKVSLTYHQEAQALRCHYCGLERAVPEACGDCGNPLLVPVGRGTEGLVAELAELLPEARVARMDRDTTRTKNAHLKILREMEDGRIDVLVGTQMIAKGHNLPGVTLVGVVCADQGFHLPDFRAGEGAFSLLTQVAGRAGRGERAGRVILQTYDPGHPALRHAVEHDYPAFAREELAMREATGFPPHGRAIRLLLRCRDGARVERAAQRLAQLVTRRPAAEVRVMGPAPPLFAQLRDEHRRHLLLTAPHIGPLRQTARWLLDQVAALPEFRSVRVDVDVDPYNLM
jgi:primosomal protein N' (replication factor Y)